MGSYNDEYREYYAKIKNRVSRKESQEKTYEKSIQSENVNQRNYEINRDPRYTQNSYKGYYGNYYRNSNSYGYDGRNATKGNKYINKFIFQLAITAMLFLGVFFLKVLPNNEAKEVYNNCKEIVEYNFSYNGFIGELKQLGDTIKAKLETSIDAYKTLN